MFDYTDKRGNILYMNRYMLAKTYNMFRWVGLPETIPSRELEKLLQRSGYAFITEVEGELYAFNGGLGGEPDAYGNPTKITISNPFLNFNETLDIETDGVLIRNDDYLIGVLPLLEKYHRLLAENDINLVLRGFNTRSQTLISASDDRTKESAEKFIKNLMDGHLSAIGENALFEGVRTHPMGTSGTDSVTSLVELHQYLKASMYNELGIKANFNMKRERLNTSEVGLNSDAVYPYVDNMMFNRLDGVERLNDRYIMGV